MPYTEKRGDGPYPWRVRWLLPARGPKGQKMYGSQPGFADEETAHNYGLDMESDIRRGKYKDPKLGATLFADWVAEWFEAKKRGLRTKANWEKDLRIHILPAFGATPLRDIDWWLVSNWAEEQTCARVSTSHRVTLMSQILNGAVDAKKVDTNPLQGRRLGGTPERRPEKTWPTPVQALQIANRLGRIHETQLRPNGMLRKKAGVDEELSRVLSLLAHLFGWTGMRSSEAYGLHKDNCGLWRRDIVDGKPWRRRVIVIDPLAGQLISYYDRNARKTLRTLGAPKPPNGAREIDLPPFLADMLDAHLADWPYDYPFCTSGGDWLQIPVVDERFGRAAAGRPARAQSKGYAALDAQEPILLNSSPHGYRHAHQTWMIEDGIPWVMRCDRLGHSKDGPDREGNREGGIQGRYSHPTPAMRKRVVEAMQTRYETAVAQLAASGGAAAAI